jgi:hypothetical protein
VEEGRDAFPVVMGGQAREADAAGDRALRARRIADAFAERFASTLPLPGSDGVPVPGRHVRCTAETPGQLYVAGQVFVRDARGRISARASGMPAGWSVRLTIVDARLVELEPGTPTSRANPAVLRAHRQMSDPALGAALAAPLRKAFPGRPVHAEVHSLFVPAGLTFVREVSVVVPLPERTADDGELLERLCAAAAAAPPARSHAPARPRVSAVRRGHLRLIQ